ncbi:MAG: 2'-5' RNA ligase family protein [Gemmatimonadaceae bacterium]|nr:2'-5' RNA ligase family protein [Gemmatimonadaceae bacterium]
MRQTVHLSTVEDNVYLYDSTATLSTPQILRRQLTLFVPAPWCAHLDALRQTLDPIQASRIAAHVTLCREDEIAHADASSLLLRVTTWADGPLRLTFGSPQRFDGHGILLPCKHGAGEFHALREWVLNRSGVRTHAAHITLAHPRNPRAPGNTDAALATCQQSLELPFATVALIEQHGNAPWNIIQQATLGGEEHER